MCVRVRHKACNRHLYKVRINPHVQPLPKPRDPLLSRRMPEQWEVSVIPCQKSITVPTTACQSLDELKEAVLNACLVAAPELVPVSWLDAGRLQQSMVLSTREDEADLTALRFKDLRTRTPALQADVVPAEEADGE